MNAQSVWFLTMLVLVAGAWHLTPWIARPELFFGVTVREDFRRSTTGRRLKGLFRLQVWLHAAIAAAIALLADVANARAAFFVAIWWLAIGGMAAWYVANRMARPYAVEPSAEREAMILPQDRGLPGNWFVKLGPYVLLAMTLAYLDFNYERLPDPYAVKYSLSGEPTRLVTKTTRAVFVEPIASMAVCLVLAGLAFSIARQSKRITVRGSAGRREGRFRRMNLTLLLGVQYYIAFLVACKTVAYQTPSAMPFAHYFLVGLALLPLPACLYLMVRYGQGGSRLADTVAEPLGLGAPMQGSAVAPIGDRTADDCWKLGQFYYNRNDPTIWIEKRAGLGYTLNFGQPLSWAILVVALVGPLVVISLVR